MLALKTLKSLIYKLDMFCSSELLRYNAETQYKTLTGGILSLAIVCVIAGGFFNMVIDTLDRVTITSSLITTKQSDPPLATLIPSSENMFMMGFSIQSIDLSYLADLNHGPQYFSLQMKMIQINFGIPTVTVVPLEPCTRQHWEMMPGFNEGFDSFGVGGWQCLPLGLPLPIQGTYTSPVNDQMLIQVYPCNNQTSNNTCASPQQIESLYTSTQNFYLSLYYINPVINPNQQEYLKHYIQGNDYVIFSPTIGSEAWVYFSDYTIKTDDSIFPFAHNSVKRGCIVQQKAINHPYSVTPNTSFASVFLAKSINSLVYNRQVQKISAVFSYIGGLVGAITALLFLIKSYTDSSLEVTIGINLFETFKQDDEQEGSFHFLGYIRLTLYRILKFIGCSKPSQRSQRLQKFQKEAVKQLDVELLLKRLIKLQQCIKRLFSPQQLAQIRQGNPITLQSAKKMRTLLLKPKSQQSEKLQMQPTMIQGGFGVQDQHLQISDQASKMDSVIFIRKHMNINDDLTPRKERKRSEMEQRDMVEQQNSQQPSFTNIPQRHLWEKDNVVQKGRNCNQVYPENWQPQQPRQRVRVLPKLK